jgi:hypothetical protein
MTHEMKMGNLKEVAAENRMASTSFRMGTFLIRSERRRKFQMVGVLQGFNGFIRTEYSISKQQNELFQYIDPDY